ncbi:hypothetical protein Golax_009852 [Gossypium laxum]|uniref:Phosphate transporter n=1 Tax=Gossypium laxum TaxID=34288 RepID=A0A7J8ZGU8_9ROSI|nr:hypothetical protein [Gossypium laxum]
MAKDQLQVLNALDVAKTQWYHFTAIIIAGMGFFTDAYDLFCISLVTKLLGRIYYHKEGDSTPGTLPSNVSAAINGVAFCGTLAGQLFFCWLGDYPLSATIMSEYTNKKTRGAFIASVFAMQGFGILAGGMIAIMVSAVFKAYYPAPSYEIDANLSTVPEADYIWRIILMNAKQAAADMSKVLQVDLESEPEKLQQKKGNEFGLFTTRFVSRHGPHLLGTTSTWFLLDIAFYSQNLFQKDIFSAIGWIPKAKTMNAIEEVYKIARAQTLIALCSTVPGY